MANGWVTVEGKRMTERRGQREKHERFLRRECFAELTCSSHKCYSKDYMLIFLSSYFLHTLSQLSRVCFVIAYYKYFVVDCSRVCCRHSVFAGGSIKYKHIYIS